MKIINRTTITDTISSNIAKNETSILPMLSTNPLVLVDWYHINKSLSTLVPGLEIADGDIVGENSKIVFDLIKDLPIGGADNLLMETEYNDEEGFTVDFSSNGFVFANTVNISEDDFFVVKSKFNGEYRKNAFRVTSYKKNYIKNLSITEFDFSFRQNSPEFISQLNKQVKNTYRCLSSNFGTESSLIIEDNKVINLKDRIDTYNDMIEAYKQYFYSQETGQILFKSTFMEPNFLFLDRIHTSLLVRNRVFYYDAVIQFGKMEFNLPARNHVIDIDLSISEADVNNTILSKIYERKPFKQCTKYPKINPMSMNIAKYQATRLVYSKEWINEDNQQFDMLDLSGETYKVDSDFYNIFDDEFISNLENGINYEITDPQQHDSNLILLKNLIIDYYNNKEIDFDNVELIMENNITFFYLFPILLFAYAKNIQQIITKINE